MVVDPAERIKELGRFLSSLKKDKSVNALHREILAGQNNPLWVGFPVKARRARYQNAVDFSEHWTDMCRGRKLPKFDRLVLPTLVALSRDEESLRNHLATAEQLWSAAHQESETSDAPETERAQQQAQPPQPDVSQLTVVAGQGVGAHEIPQFEPGFAHVIPHLVAVSLT